MTASRRAGAFALAVMGLAIHMCLPRSGPAAAQSTRYEELLSESRALLTNGELGKAGERARAAAALDDTRYEAYELAALVARRLGDQTALAVFVQAALQRLSEPHRAKLGGDPGIGFAAASALLATGDREGTARILESLAKSSNPSVSQKATEFLTRLRPPSVTGATPSQPQFEVAGRVLQIYLSPFYIIFESTGRAPSPGDRVFVKADDTGALIELKVEKSYGGRMSATVRVGQGVISAGNEVLREK